MASYLQGRRFGVQGDSYSTNFNFAWQNVVSARTGMTLVSEDAYPGRTFGTAFQCYGNPSPGGTLGTFTAGLTMQPFGGVCGTFMVGETGGNTLAQNLENVDVEIIELSTNDVISEPLGQLGDPVTAGTFYGDMRWVVENYLGAKPTLRVVLVTIQNLPNFAPAAGQYADAMVIYGNSMGVPVINMFALGGVNTITAPTLLRDGVHPSDFAFANFFGPVIAQQVQQLF